jgi:hypothetical protein
VAGLAGVLGTVTKGMNTRMLASLTVADVVERAVSLLEGESDVATFLKGLKDDTNFNMIASIPVGRLLGALVNSQGQAEAVENANEVPVMPV